MKELIISVMDLTSLNLDDTVSSIKNLCNKASSPLGNVAAVCVYSKFVTSAIEFLKDTDIKVATVANFPAGKCNADETVAELQNAIKSGADELDVVFPYQTYNSGNAVKALDFIKKCKETSKDKMLKVILEVSEFSSEDIIYEASRDIIKAGADFIKTSTGKSHAGATLASATAMLNAIRNSNTNTGFKVSGGVRTVAQALAYINLAKQIFDEKFITPTRFRIGASSLWEDVLNHPRL